jgi:hypothetical protein
MRAGMSQNAPYNPDNISSPIVNAAAAAAPETRSKAGPDLHGCSFKRHMSTFEVRQSVTASGFRGIRLTMPADGSNVVRLSVNVVG